MDDDELDAATGVASLTPTSDGGALDGFAGRRVSPVPRVAAGRHRGARVARRVPGREARGG